MGRATDSRISVAVMTPNSWAAIYSRLHHGYKNPHYYAWPKYLRWLCPHPKADVAQMSADIETLLDMVIEYQEKERTDSYATFD